MTKPVITFIQLSSVVLLISFTSLINAQTTITEFAPSTNTDFGIWYESDVRLAGTASIVDLTDTDTALEMNQPSPPGAALITTTFDNNDKAEVGVLNEFGIPSDIFSSLNLNYHFFKANNPGQNLSAAPALKLAFFNPVCDDPASAGDCFGTLVYEPTWNGPTSSSTTPVSTPVITDTWIPVSINQNNGLFWWTGGFGQPNTAGGPPINSLAGWLSTFSSDFADATLVQVSIGVGTFNQGQVGYFDDVQISHSFGDGIDELFDFGPAQLLPAITPVPALSSFGEVILVLLLLSIGLLSIRQRIKCLHEF